MLVGYAGLVSLGHAALFGIAAYATGYMLQAGFGHTAADLAALLAGLASMAVFAVLSLRTTGIGFIMITLALGEILWGLAYRWISLTGGDNGISLHGRPGAVRHFARLAATPFYYATLVVFLLAFAAVAVFVRSPFGAALMGTRDQPRRMNALGYHVWAIRFWACMFSGLLTSVAGILFVYYTQFISPQTLALTSSAEVLLMVISGGAGTLLGPIVGAALVVMVKSVVSGFIERWNLLLGAIFVAIVILMPEGLVPGSARLWRLALRKLRAAAQIRRDGSQAMSALTVSGLSKAFGGLHVTRDVNLDVEPGERRLIIGPNGAGKTTLFNLITGELTPDAGSIQLFGNDITQVPSRRRAASRHGAHLPDHHAVPARHHHPQRVAGAARPVAGALESAHRHQAPAAISPSTAARRSSASASATSPSGRWRRPPTASAAASRSPWRWRKIRKLLLLDEPFAGLSIDERRDVHQLLMAIPRDVTIVMIEHNMDVALEFAERITLLHFGEVIVEGNRAEVVADPRTREVYLGH